MKKTDRDKEYLRLLKAITLNNIVIIQGLRRIGKTLLMNSISNDKIFQNRKIINFIVDMFGQDENKEALNIIETIKNNKNTNYLLLVDEFQKLDKWGNFFKTLHNFSNVKVIATGSVSANIDMVMHTEGGRFYYIYMEPLSFLEFKKIFGDTFRNDDEAFNKFATMGSYPDQEFNDDLIMYKKQIYENIIEKIKNSTLLKAANIKDAQQVNNVLLFLIENVGQTLSINHITNKLNDTSSIDIRTVKKIINYLKQSFIIYEVANSKQGKGKAAQSNIKYYLTDHTFYLFVKQSSFENLEGKYKSFIFENIIFNEIRKHHSRHELEVRFEKDNKTNADIDLVIIKNDKKTYFEIKNTYSKTCLSKRQKEFSKNNKLNIIYLGESCQDKNTRYINYIEFITNIKEVINDNKSNEKQ